jgi:hypothetical protein
MNRSLNIDRRSLIGGGASAIAVAAVALPVPALAAATADRSDWDAAMRAYQLAKAEDEAFDPTYWPIHNAWEAGRPSMNAIDWKRLNPVPGNKEHIARIADLGKLWHRYLDGEGKWWWAGDPEKSKAEFRAALDSVQAFRDAEERHDRESGLDEANERYEDLGERVNLAQEALMGMAAPDLAALRWKLDQLHDPGGDMPAWSAYFVRQTFADIARLLPEGC